MSHLTYNENDPVYKPPPLIFSVNPLSKCYTVEEVIDDTEFSVYRPLTLVQTSPTIYERANKVVYIPITYTIDEIDEGKSVKINPESKIYTAFTIKNYTYNMSGLYIINEVVKGKFYKCSYVDNGTKSVIYFPDPITQNYAAAKSILNSKREEAQNAKKVIIEKYAQIQKNSKVKENTFSSFFAVNKVKKNVDDLTTEEGKDTFDYNLTYIEMLNKIIERVDKTLKEIKTREEIFQELIKNPVNKDKSCNNSSDDRYSNSSSGGKRKSRGAGKTRKSRKAKKVQKSRKGKKQSRRRV